MSTTPFKPPKHLKLRASTAAEELGISTKASMVGTVRQTADPVEQRTHFVSQAQAARADMLQSGQGHEANEVRAYLRARLADPSSTRPDGKLWRG